jgi:hypothetical protein
MFHNDQLLLVDEHLDLPSKTCMCDCVEWDLLSDMKAALRQMICLSSKVYIFHVESERCQRSVPAHRA